MENKINIAALLKDCPKGMELDCTLFEGLEFDDIIDNEYLPIRCRVKNPDGGYNVYNFTKYGCWLDTTFAKCVIFPKGKTTWEGFQRPFKDGDIVAGENRACSYITIFRKLIDNTSFSHHACLTSFGEFKIDDFADNSNLRIATEEEKEKLFNAIKAKGYKWNTETKTLEKIIVPKFKVGDKIIKKDTPTECWYVQGVDTDRNSDYFYCIVAKGKIANLHFKDQNEWELVPSKFDISTLIPFESRVLVRNKYDDFWEPAIFGVFYAKEHAFKFCIVGSRRFEECIPYEGNEHLLGTNNDCDEYYKTWE